MANISRVPFHFETRFTYSGNTLPFILIINGHAILLKNLRILKRKLLRK